MNKSTLPAFDKRPGDEVKHQVLMAILDDDTAQWLEYMARDASARSGVDWSQGEIVRRLINACRLAYVADMMQKPRSKSLSAVSFLNHLEGRSKVFAAMIEGTENPASEAEGGEDSQPAK